MELNLNLDALEITQDVCKLSSPKKNVVKENALSSTRRRRSLRPKKSVQSSIINRRTINKPKKLSLSNNLTDVKDYYMCRKVKRLPSTLETIFEEPKKTKTDVQYMSLKKFKRALDFPSDDSNPQKLTKRKKRLLKAKKLTSQHRINNKKKIELDMLLNKLADLDAENENQT